MIRIESIESEPLAEVRYLNAAPGGGTTVERLAIVRARAGALADELDAIVCCSDLQGIVPGEGGRATLLGIAVAEELEELAAAGTLPPAARTGVVLAGDLYSVPAANKRGGYGEVAAVWEAFADRFAWVTGVAGNHDDVAGVAELGGHVYLLDGERAVVDGLRIAGVGGIIGTKPKPGRRPEHDQLERIRRAIAGGIDLLVLHEGPHGERKQIGNAEIRELVETAAVPLTVCGHAHWVEPLAVHPGGQILNVDARVVVLLTAPARR